MSNHFNHLLNRSLRRARWLVSAAWLGLALGAPAYGQTLLYKWNFDGATGSGASVTVPPAVVDTADGYTGGNLSLFVTNGFTVSTPASSGLGGSTNAIDLGLVNSGTYNSAASVLAGGVGDMSKITNFTVSLWFNLNAGVTNFGSVNGAGFNARLFCIDTNKNGTGGTAADGNELYLGLAMPAAGAGPLRIQFGVFVASGQVFATPFGNVGGASAAAFTNQWVFIAASYTQAANGTANIYVGTTNQGVSLAATMTGVGSFTNAAKTWLSTSNLVEIGNRVGGTGNRALMGSIDDVRLYGSALTLPQIQTVQGVVSPPVITAQPTSSLVFAGQAPQLSVSAAGTLPLSYKWTRNGTNLVDGGNISGSSSNILTITGVSAADVSTNYSVIVTNVAGAVTSSVASLALTSPSGAYESAVVADNPFAFYTFSETNDPSTGIAEAYDSIGAFNGTYGTTAQNAFNGVAGPRTTADGLIGFTDTNTALNTTYLDVPPTSFVTLPPFNLNNGAGTNVLTITAWINPSGPQVHAAPIVFCRSGSTAAGLVYNATNNNDGNLKLGYNWNNDVNTYTWDSGLEPTPGIWSLVALVVTPSNATIYVINTNGLLASTHVYNHVAQTFAGPTLIGSDSQSANGGRNFNGSIDEVALFGQALTQNQVSSLFAAASGISFFPPTIGGGPTWVPSTVYQGQAASITISAGGTAPLSYQWMAGLGGNYTNLTDGGNISGSTTMTLTITNAALSNSLDYIVVLTNAYGAATSAPPATLTVNPIGPALNVTLSTLMPLSAPTTDWNSAGYWSDTNGGSLGASTYLIGNPNSTFEVLAGGRLRTPNPATGPFPGNFADSLQLDGAGVLDPSGATMGELRCKSTPVTIAHLIMNGGQLDASAGTGTANITVINGQMDILANTPIYDDSANDQGMTINSFLTGQGNIELDDTGFGLTNGTPLNIAGQTNIYSGTWNVVLGVLLGTGHNALGTNAITVGPTGYLETTYDLNNPNGSLTLNGQMLLHQNDHFASVTVNGAPLPNGIYPFAALSSAYPANFPASWPPQTGSAFTTGSGQIIVGNVAPSPRITSIRLSGTALSIAATNGAAGGSWTLLQSTNVTLPLSQWQTNTAGQFDGSGNLSTNIVNTATNIQEFYILKVK